MEGYTLLHLLKKHESVEVKRRIPTKTVIGQWGTLTVSFNTFTFSVVSVHSENSAIKEKIRKTSRKKSLVVNFSFVRHVM